MTTLSEIARDVAEALGLYDHPGSAWLPAWSSGNPRLERDGSNLTDPYWRCRCEDWLLAQGTFSHVGSEAAEFVPLNLSSACVEVECPWPEAPARLVSAVWRRKLP